jgi:hypothetical protein
MQQTIIYLNNYFLEFSFFTKNRVLYNLRGVSFPHTTPEPSQTTVSTFHLRTLPGLQFNQVLHTKPKLNIRNLWPPIVSDHSIIYCGIYLRLAIANDLSLAIGFTRID